MKKPLLLFCLEFCFILLPFSGLLGQARDVDSELALKQEALKQAESAHDGSLAVLVEQIREWSPEGRRVALQNWEKTNSQALEQLGAMRAEVAALRKAVEPEVVADFVPRAIPAEATAEKAALIQAQNLVEERLYEIRQQYREADPEARRAALIDFEKNYASAFAAIEQMKATVKAQEGTPAAEPLPELVIPEGAAPEAAKQLRREHELLKQRQETRNLSPEARRAVLIAFEKSHPEN